MPEANASTADATFSIDFSTETFNPFLFASGDEQVWLVATVDAVIGENYELADRDVIYSTISSEPYTAKWYNRASAGEDPWVSIVDHADSFGSNVDTTSLELLICTPLPPLSP